eukprot:scaffold46181_cov96-Attheya_sp.AAC.4
MNTNDKDPAAYKRKVFITILLVANFIALLPILIKSLKISRIIGPSGLAIDAIVTVPEKRKNRKCNDMSAKGIIYDDKGGERI